MREGESASDQRTAAEEHQPVGQAGRGVLRLPHRDTLTAPQETRTPLTHTQLYHIYTFTPQIHITDDKHYQ